MSGLELRRGDSPFSLMFAVDRSGSMSGYQLDRQHQQDATLTNMRPDDRAGLVLFGATPVIVRRLGSNFEFTRPSPSSDVGTTTNIESALRVARASLPREGARRVVLISDGRQTTGDALAEAARAAAAGVPIDVVIPDVPSATSVEVMRVTAPRSTRVGEPFTVTVTVRGNPGTHGAITLTEAGGQTRSAKVTIPGDGFVTASFPLAADEAGIRTYEATAEATGDAGELSSEPRRAGAVVTVAGETKILYVGATPALVAPLVRGAGFRIQHITPDALPRSAASLSAFDGIVLDAVRADAIEGPQASALRAHVERHGGGVVFLGTRDTLDAAALTGHALGELLPIDVRPRGGQRAPSLGLVVAFDKSGSMDDRVDGVPRIEFARLAVRRVIDAIPASDAVGVIAFDSAAHAVAPLSSRHDPAELASRLQAVIPSGATAIAPAIEMAAAWLREGGDLSRRHVLLVSDGRTSADDTERLRAVLAQGQFELSVVALGADADQQLLESLARGTGGRAYFPGDIRDLPAIVARESARVTGGRLVEQPFEPVVGPHPVIGQFAATPFPPLGGYVVSAAKPSADAPLQSPLNDPVLATWRLGLGRVAVYTAELHGPWSSRLRAWEGFPRFFNHLVRWTSRRGRDEALYVQVKEESDGLRLIVETQDEDGRPVDYQCHATVRTPTGETLNLSVPGISPGRYEAPLQPTSPGAYVFAVAGHTRDGLAESHVVRGFYWAADREYRHPGPDVPLLERVAEMTGGHIHRRGQQAFDIPRGSSYFEVSPWLTLAALLLFLAEVLLAMVPRITGHAEPGSSVPGHAREAA